VRLAVLNLKGGTGKTTTAVSLAAGLAEAGQETLLLDLDAQGHAASSLGAKTSHGLYELLVDGWPARQCAVRVRKHLHVMGGEQKLVALELWLAQQGGQGRLLSERLGAFESAFRYVILDCGPAQSSLNLNGLLYAQRVLVPVSCDYLSLLGVKQMLRSFEQIRKAHGSKVEIWGILPTFYDRRNRMSDEAMKTLKGYFREKVLSPIRINTTLKEAPQQQKSIFEYAPNSAGSFDYRRLVQQILGNSEGSEAVYEEGRSSGGRPEQT
jgi:chromosome partitioning protein